MVHKDENSLFNYFCADKTCSTNFFLIKCLILKNFLSLSKLIFTKTLSIKTLNI